MQSLIPLQKFRWCLAAVAFSLLLAFPGPAIADDPDEGAWLDLLPTATVWGPRARIGQARLRLLPTVSVGSHTNRAGAGLDLRLPLSEFSGALERLVLWSQAAYTCDLTPLGIPERTHQFAGFVGMVAGWGAGRPGSELPFAAPGRHNLFYQFEVFRDTAGTGQLSGALGYIYSAPGFSTRVVFENDILAFTGEDAYRTGALEWSLHLRRWGHPVGVGAGFLAWTGSTPRPNDLTRDDVYDLSDRHGGAYSHGILYGAVFFRMLKLSFGWDSEAARDRIQNGLHTLIDDGSIPPLPRRSRFFILLSIHPLQTLY